MLLTNPDAHQTLRALEAMDLIIVQDLFLTETAKAVGTVFLPCASSFEMDGTFVGTVTEEIFRGPLVELFIESEKGLEVTAIVPNRTADREAPSKGDRVTWWVHRDDVVVVPKERG